ncbi:MAG: hypothetical protein NC089_03080 [Bacteroides sp.]|nr:hypothetical protein [Bacteroides sp.]MCM1549523.1 hypothetical protein [Clostridium sp.]
MNIINICKGRGVTILRTDKGMRVLQPLGTSESRLEQEAWLKEELYLAGYSNIDRFIRNKEGEFITCDRYHTPYVLKEYFDGKECNIRLEADMTAAVMNLGKLHLALQKVEPKAQRKELKTFLTFQRHNQELKRVRNYMRQIPTKSEFDYLYLSCFELFYRQGEEVVKQLDRSRESILENRWYYCHGAYHQHNVLICKEGMATVNFEHFMIDNQLVDLYTFLRKAMEKNEYQPELLFHLIDTYHQCIPLGREDYIFLYYLLWYPEKFWKISNQYNNMNKAWIPPKTFEKLQTVIRQEELKQKLLQQYQEHYGLNLQK